ncbi:MAG: sulfotransferase domain-containing protein [Pseudomonadota bacterium]
MHPIDSPLAQRSNVARKAIAYSLQGPRTARRFTARPDDYRRAPPVIANSIPKSGTHLLLQIARALPRARYYGSFLSWASSLDLRKRSERSIAFHLDRVVPGEALGAHLHYSEATSAKLETINALHLMIVREYEEIIRSEAHYLKHMNRFHRMAREFRGLDAPACIERVRKGSPSRPDLYPAFAERVRPYEGWRDDPRVLIVRYEDLANPATRAPAVERIVHAWATRAEGSEALDLEAYTHQAVASIAPQRSHTYSNRRGG